MAAWQGARDPGIPMSSDRARRLWDHVVGRMSPRVFMPAMLGIAAMEEQRVSSRIANLETSAPSLITS